MSNCNILFGMLHIADDKISKMNKQASIPVIEKFITQSNIQENKKSTYMPLFLKLKIIPYSIVPSKLFDLSNLRKIAEDFFQIIEDDQ